MMEAMTFHRKAALLLVLCLLACFATNADTRGRKKTLKGWLVDISCATERKQESDLGRKHSRKCLTMTECAKSGYALLTPDKKVLRFDAAGNEAAKKLIVSASQERDFKIVVSGRVLEDQIAVTRLELQKQQ